MIIVCTKDPVVVNWSLNPLSGSPQWGNVLVLPANADRMYATVLLGYALSFIGQNEPLCLNAHGNNTEIGDAAGPHDWVWNVNTIAGVLGYSVPNGYAGPILIRACATEISNFSTRLAVSLQNGQLLNGVWIYGYNNPLPITQGFPAPANLDNPVDLQAAQVVF